jgi:GMP synthase-like glutamine amidotransferase
MKIGVLETGEVSPELRARHGAYPDMFERLLGGADPEFQFRTFSVVNGEMPATAFDADAWLITGSRHGVYDELPWIAPLMAFLRKAHAAGVPLVGICFGHQILAEALGGHAGKSERGWGLGVHEYRTVLRPRWMRDVGDTFAMRAVHQDQVTAIPIDATVLAVSEHCPYAVLAYGDPERPTAISIQPHPEFTREFVDDLILARTGSTFPEDLAAAARRSLSREAANEPWARAIAAYLNALVR